MKNQLNFETPLTATHSGMRLDAALAELLPKYSRSQLTKWIKEGSILLDGKQIKPTYKVKGIENVIFDCPLPPQTLLVPQAIDLDIHYEDEDVLILNKHANWVVHPGAGNPDNTIVNALLHHDNDLEKLPRAGIIHRLDKDTSGLLIVAKNLESYYALIKQMQAREIQRHYQAVVYGECEYPETIETFMGRHPTNRTKMAVLKQGKHKSSFNPY
jgi:23S rRNA pseudouridine1911/1915/1917 synthase